MPMSDFFTFWVIYRLGYTPDPHRKLKEDINATMQPLITSVQYTAVSTMFRLSTQIFIPSQYFFSFISLIHTQQELYHELNTLDRFDQDYRRKVEEERSNSVQKGTRFHIRCVSCSQQIFLPKNLEPCVNIKLNFFLIQILRFIGIFFHVLETFFIKELENHKSIPNFSYTVFLKICR